ncbi:dihydroxyacetone kinase phosphoryl donor subunit DhaM [Clostridium neuense]|uniref:phosphoenolpyruvate--glycerone phosphotransferase n=1 Tax=Clostridium neuense TaxID=1728934 RepID=A0ABW8TAS4_9CLOT
MVGIVIVSHSFNLAIDIKELSKKIASNAKIAVAGGTEDGRFGTDVKRIIDAINEVYSDDGVIIIFDMGSAYISAEMAVDCIDECKKNNVEIVDTALVEGSLTAAVEAGIGKNKEEIMKSLKTMCLNKTP